ncbi:MAG: tRNA epoxyqueuosine(34) reductase QueG [Flavobacteriales bacterium]
MTSADLLGHARSNRIKEIAASLGFMDCRIAKAERLDEEANQLEEWLGRGYHGQMAYMQSHFEKRVNPQALVPGAKSVIVLSQNYFTENKQKDSTAPKISKYAYGRDYHKVIKKKLKQFHTQLRSEFGDVNGRGFVDSAPVLEKAWAKRSGLGWIGKHSNVLTKQKGSFFFLAVLITDLELAPDGKVKDHCGNCTACIDSCPTDAIVAPYLVDGSRCISYFTIELKDEKIPDEFIGRFNNWMFGCDICQDVCPWNRFSRQHNEFAFEPKDELLSMSAKDWENLKLEAFEELFLGSAVKRVGYRGLMRNVQFLPTIFSDERNEPSKRK